MDRNDLIEESADNVVSMLMTKDLQMDEALAALSLALIASALSAEMDKESFMSSISSHWDAISSTEDLEDTVH